MGRPRVIMHIDMDAFFAAVEQKTNGKLRGRPIAVCGSRKRSVVTSASYEARPYGVKAGMPIHLAKKLCPSLVLVEGDMPKYIHTSMRLLPIFKEFTPKVEMYSIDEAFLDITGSLLLFSGAEHIARRVKQRIQGEFGLTCSIGIAPNKLIAKLASEMKKPDGLTVITPGDIPRVLKGLPVKKLPGIGKGLASQLASMGVETCEELGRIHLPMARSRFGIIGARLQKMGQGADSSPVISFEEESGIKSVGHSLTLDQDIFDRERIKRYILQLSERVGRRLRRQNCWGRTVTLTLRYCDFFTFSKQLTIRKHINGTPEIYDTASLIFDTIRLKEAVRLIGVRVSNLSGGCAQLSLFSHERKKQRALQIMDKVNDRYGEFTLISAPLLDNFSHERL